MIYFPGCKILIWQDFYFFFSTLKMAFHCVLEWVFFCWEVIWFIVSCMRCIIFLCLHLRFFFGFQYFNIMCLGMIFFIFIPLVVQRSPRIFKCTIFGNLVAIILSNIFSVPFLICWDDNYACFIQLILLYSSLRLIIFQSYFSLSFTDLISVAPSSHLMTLSSVFCILWFVYSVLSSRYYIFRF